MSTISTLSMRVRLGWATESEKVLLASLIAEEKHNWDEYFKVMESARTRREAQTIPSISSNWLRPMAMDDYIEPGTRRIKQEPESFEEQRERVMRKTQ